MRTLASVRLSFSVVEAGSPRLRLFTRRVVKNSLMTPTTSLPRDGRSFGKSKVLNHLPKRLWDAIHSQAHLRNGIFVGVCT